MRFRKINLFYQVPAQSIPFAAKDPLRVISIMMLSSAIVSVLTFISQIQVPAPHGGFLVLPLVNKPFLWVGCIFTGALVGAILLGLVRIHQNRQLATKVHK